MGYWNASIRPWYPFDEPIAEQVLWIQQKMDVLRTINLSRDSTYIDLLIE